MITSTVLKLTTKQDRVPRTQGHLTQAAFLAMIHSVNPALSDTLHIEGQRRPYTISPLRRGSNGISWLRFTVLNDELFNAMTECLLNSSQGVNIRIGDTTFDIVEILNTGHPWAGYTTVDLLRQSRSLNSEISVEFASPTVFKSYASKLMNPFPSPDLFFGSLAVKWNDHIPNASLDSYKVRNYAHDTVVLGSFDVRTKMLHYKGHPQIGTEGRVTYLLKDTDNREMIYTLNRLADFAFYSGVGCKVSMGMGQVCRSC